MPLVRLNVRTALLAIVFSNIMKMRDSVRVGALFQRRNSTCSINTRGETETIGECAGPLDRTLVTARRSR